MKASESDLPAFFVLKRLFDETRVEEKVKRTESLLTVNLLQTRIDVTVDRILLLQSILLNGLGKTDAILHTLLALRLSVPLVGCTQTRSVVFRLVFL